MSTPYGQQYPPQDGQSGEQGTGQQSGRNNPMAVTSMVLSLAGIVTFCLGLGSLLGILGVVFGHVGLSQIKRDGSQGRGMALAGVIIGYVLIALGIVLGIIVASTGAMQFHSM